MIRNINALDKFSFNRLHQVVLFTQFVLLVVLGREGWSQGQTGPAFKFETSQHHFPKVGCCMPSSVQCTPLLCSSSQIYLDYQIRVFPTGLSVGVTFPNEQRPGEVPSLPEKYLRHNQIAPRQPGTNIQLLLS